MAMQMFSVDWRKEFLEGPSFPVIRNFVEVRRFSVGDDMDDLIAEHPGDD